MTGNPMTDTRPRIRITYDVVTPESAEHGDFAESGWIDEDGYVMEPDDDETLVDCAVRFLKRECIGHASSSHFHPGIWYTTDDGCIDYRTGADRQRSFHLKCFTEADERAIFEALRKEIS